MATPRQPKTPQQIVHKRKQLGEGTTFSVGKRDPAISDLIQHVEEHGYVILPEIFSPAEVAAAKLQLDHLEILQQGPSSQNGRNPFEGFKTRRVYALLDKTRDFDPFAIHPTVLALNDYFLQENYLLSTFQTVNILPGEGVQTLHTDDGLISLPRPRPLMGIGTMVALDAFTAANGSTVIIPKSHLWPESRAPSRDETVSVSMAAGSMLYFLNTLWHGGGANTSAAPRRSLSVQYCQPWLRPFENMMVAVGWEHLDVLPKRIRDLCGYSTHVFTGHVDGRAPRTGVEERKKRLIEGALKVKRGQAEGVGEGAKAKLWEAKL